MDGSPVGQGFEFVIVSWLFLILLVYVLYRLVRWIRDSVNRSVKAKQDMARSFADLTDRIDKIEQRLEGQGQSKS